MITMNEFINSTNQAGKKETPAQNQYVKNETKIPEQKNDSFEKTDKSSKKITKKQRNFIIAGIVTAIALTAAFIKRKDIAKFFNGLFKKKTVNIPNAQKAGVSFPQKPFTNNPTPEQKKEYVKNLLKYIGGNRPSVEDKVKAINEINKYGIDDLDKMVDYLSDDNDEIVQSTIKTYARWGNKKYADRVIIPFLDSDASLTSRSETYIEALKTVQKLADLSDYTEKEREDLFYRHIRKLLNHTDEKVRAMAKETLDKITIKE